MYGNNSWDSNNSRFGVGRGNGLGVGIGIGAGVGAGGIGGLMGGNGNPQDQGSPTIQPTSPEAKARLGIVDAPTGVDRSGMDASYQKRHFADLAAADAKYAGSANDIAQTGLDQQAINNRMQLGTAAQNYNTQSLEAKNKKESTVYDPKDYNTWFDDMV